MYLCVMKIWVVLVVLFCVGAAHAQNEKQSTVNAIPVVVDSLYREDQFYISISFNLINNEPTDFSQNGFSGGLHLGFIRDMPFNQKRNKAIGLGLGLARNTFNTNLFIDENASGTSTFEIIDNIGSVERNRLVINTLELPIQYRWRTSTATDYTFWRVYTGVKLSYIFSHAAKFKDSNRDVIRRDVDELQLFRYAATLTVGNGSFNGFVQYDLNPLFGKNALVNGQLVTLQPIKFGVEFYIL